MGCHLCAEREDKNVLKKKKQEETVEEEEKKKKASWQRKKKKQWEENCLCVWWKEKEWKETVKKVSLQSDPLLPSQMRTSPEIYSNRFGEKSSQTFFLYLLVSLCFLSSLQEKKKKRAW